MNTNIERPVWFARRNISPFTLDEQSVKDVIAEASHAVVSWVTQDNQPVSAVMLYALIDDVITVTSTTNRAKYHAWHRNPSACFCIWDPESIGRQVTLRGKVEILKDAQLLRRFTEAFLTKNMGGTSPPPALLQSEFEKFDAPDRHMMRFHIEKVLSHDLHYLLKVEQEGTDVWS